MGKFCQQKTSAYLPIKGWMGEQTIINTKNFLHPMIYYYLSYFLLYVLYYLILLSMLIFYDAYYIKYKLHIHQCCSFVFLLLGLSQQCYVLWFTQNAAWWHRSWQAKSTLIILLIISRYETSHTFCRHFGIKRI